LDHAWLLKDSAVSNFEARKRYKILKGQNKKINFWFFNVQRGPKSPILQNKIKIGSKYGIKKMFL